MLILKNVSCAVYLMFVVCASVASVSLTDPAGLGDHDIVFAVKDGAEDMDIGGW